MVEKIVVEKGEEVVEHVEWEEEVEENEKMPRWRRRS